MKTYAAVINSTERTANDTLLYFAIVTEITRVQANSYDEAAGELDTKIAMGYSKRQGWASEYKWWIRQGRPVMEIPS